MKQTETVRLAHLLWQGISSSHKILEGVNQMDICSNDLIEESIPAELELNAGGFTAFLHQASNIPTWERVPLAIGAPTHQGTPQFEKDVCLWALETRA